MNIGIKKSFDIPQPRIKYYDVNVICFNDMNGDGVRGEEEPLLSNIKLQLSKIKDENSKDFIRFGEQELVSNTKGEILLTDLPQGAYSATFEPLFNLGNLYNAKGDEQEIEVVSDMDYYIPYVESYQVNGFVSLIRDEFSDKGLVNVNGVRVEAVNEKGETFAALTDQSGHYVINVPQAGYFTVKVNNVFGEGFEIDKDKFLIQFDGFKQYTVDFTFYEGKKEINFGDGASFFNFKSLTVNKKSLDTANNVDVKNDSIKTKSIKDDVLDLITVVSEAMQPKEDLEAEISVLSKQNLKLIPKDFKKEDVRFLIEIGMVVKFLTNEYTILLSRLNVEPTPILVNGISIYASTIFKSRKEANDLLEELKRLGFTEGVIVSSIGGKVFIK